MNPKIDAYLIKEKKWQPEMQELRRILLECQLTEELKWGKPCYTYKKNNVVILYGLKEFCGPGFFKGALLNDTNGILAKPGENSQSTRYIKCTNTQQIIEMEAVLKAYIYEAIEVERAGLKVDFKEKNELVFSEELLKKLDANSALKTAFEALTPGRQRGYNLYFSAPKQSKTRNARIEKYMQKILDGKGFHDCTCGLSKKFPQCDGSHKFIPKL